MSSKRVWVGVFLSAGLLVSLSAFGQTFQTAPGSEIGRITRQAGMIDNSINGNAVKMKTFTRGDESGVLSYYAGAHRAGKLVVQLVSLQSGYVTEYYFLDSQLIYVVRACKSFGSSSGQSSAKSCPSISENRFFLSDGDLVAWLQGTGPGPITMSEVAADQGTLRAKLVQITRSASTWMAFAESSSRNFDRFEAERQAGN